MSPPPQLPAASFSQRLTNPIDSKPGETLAVVKSLHDLRKRLDKLSHRLEQFAPVKTCQPNHGKHD